MKHRWIPLPLLTLLLVACGGGVSEETPIQPGMSSGKLLSMDYGGFGLLFDCAARSAIRFEYRLEKDTGNLVRPANYTFDPTLPRIVINKPQPTVTQVWLMSGIEGT